MRVILPLFLIACFLIVGFQLFSSGKLSDPTSYAEAFVKRIQAGDYQKAVESFGGNICRCPAKLGWVSYMIYSSGEEPNLSCLMGQRFSHGPTTFKTMASDTKASSVLDRPEDFEVMIPLKFDQNYRPLFLPMDMAYGYDITTKQLDNFLANPDFESWKALTLRMRPSLKKGTADQPEESKHLVSKSRSQQELEAREKGTTVENLNKASQHSQQTGSQNDSQKRPVDQDALEKELLGDEAARYNVPKDAGAVKAEDGTTLDQTVVEARLPRLKSARLRLHMVRRDSRQPFTVFHFVIADPVLVFPDGHELALKNFKPPLEEH